jgi:hypothetical protein
MNLEQRQFIWQHAGYTPTPEQLAIHTDPARIKLVAGGERAGKSLSAAMELLTQVIGVEGLWWIVGPDYEQSRNEFDYVLAAVQKIGAAREVNRPRIGSCRLITAFNGEIVTKTADDVRKLAGKAPDGVLLVEAAQTEWEVWIKLRGRVAEKRGWLWASGTFEEGAQWYTDIWTRWQADNPEGGKSFSLPTWCNLAVFPGGRADPELLALEATLPADLFQERYGAVPCKPSGLVFKEFSFERHVREIAWRYYIQPGMISGHHKDALAADMAWPIEIAVDPGYAGGYAVLAVTWKDDLVYIFDEVYQQGMVAEDIITMAARKWWWKKVRSGVIDVAGLQHPGQRSQVEIWRHAAGVNLRVNRIGIVEGILRLRTFLVNPETGEPRIYFAPKCRGLLAEFGKYRYPKDSDNRPVTELPIDRDNHALKALSYWLYDRYGPVMRRHRQPQDIGDPFGYAEQEVGRTIGLLRGKTPEGVRFGIQRGLPEPGLSFDVE